MWCGKKIWQCGNYVCGDFFLLALVCSIGICVNCLCDIQIWVYIIKAFFLFSQQQCVSDFSHEIVMQDYHTMLTYLGHMRSACIAKIDTIHITQNVHHILTLGINI